MFNDLFFMTIFGTIARSGFESRSELLFRWESGHATLTTQKSVPVRVDIKLPPDLN